MSDDLLAGWRHFTIRALAVARDPWGLGVLALAGLLTILPTAVLSALHPVAWLVFQPERLTGIATFTMLLASVLVLWSVIVATTAVGRPSGSASARPTPGRALPALPIGLRTRAVAEALAGLAVALAARLAILAIGGEPLARRLMPGYAWSRLGDPAEMARATAIGLLLVLPVVLAFTAMVRRDGPGLLKPALTIALVLAGVLAGVFARLWSALLLAITLSAFILVRPDDGDRPGARAGGRPLRLLHRISPGPLLQLRRDAWLGPVRALWVVGVVGLALPLALVALDEGRFFFLPPLQALLLLAVLPFFPFGMKLVGPGDPLFGGRFLRSWSFLPVPRERAVRSVYAHGLITAGAAWLVFSAFVLRQVGARGLTRASLFGLPAVFLAAAIVTCEAVGDRRRGLLAAGCLAGYLMIVPVAVFLAHAALDLPAGAVRTIHSEWLWRAEAFGLGLLGSIPPLVHLRRGAPGPT
jgi:hypothetical protein